MQGTGVSREGDTIASSDVDGTWTFPESRWRSLQMRINSDGKVHLIFLLTQNWSLFGKVCCESQLTPLPRNPGPHDGFIPPHSLVTALVSERESGTSWEPWQGGCLCFCRQTRWCLGVSKKVWILVPEDRESPSTEGKEVAGEEEFVIGEKFKPALMSSWRERISF